MGKIVMWYCDTISSGGEFTMPGVEVGCNREGSAPTVSWLHVPGKLLSHSLCLSSDQSDRSMEHGDPEGPFHCGKYSQFNPQNARKLSNSNTVRLKPGRPD